MFSLPFQLFRFPVTFIAIGVLIFGFLCAGVFSMISMDMSGMNTGMISEEHRQQCCSISTSHDMDSWKNIVLTAPDKTRDALTLLALGLSLILGYSWVSLWNRRPLIGIDVGRLRLYERDNPDITLFNHLKLAFARGILSPKIY